MNLEFDIQNVTVTEFGVGQDVGNKQSYFAVSVDANVKDTLKEMIQATWDAMQKVDGGPAKYEPSEKYESIEYLYLPQKDILAKGVFELYSATNLLINSHVLDDLSDVFCYFARLTDKKGRHLTAIRRATQFKGVVKSRLIHIVTDALKLIDDRVFKLDTDFDLLVDSSNVHILHPSGFEFAGKLQQMILDAVPKNIKLLRKDLAFVEFDGIETYALKHPRAARYLASIRGQSENENIDKAALKKLCKNTSVEITEKNQKLVVTAGNELGFLEVLDRRRYELELVKNQPEQFKAASRRKLNG